MRSQTMLASVFLIGIAVFGVFFAAGVLAQSPDGTVDLDGVLTPMPAIYPDPATDSAQQAADVGARDQAVLSALESGSWEQQFPSVSPSQRGDYGFAYDSARTVFVLFGGIYGSAKFNETWEYDGLNWTQRFPAQSPSARDRVAMAYDPDRAVVVLFGGNGPGTSFQNDTWEYDVTNWVQRSPSTSPSPRNGAAKAYDPIRDVMLLFGGYHCCSPTVFYDDTWEYDGAQWTQRSPAHHPATRETATIVHDAARGRMVLFGGGRSAGSVVYNDTWEWDGSDWTQRTLSQSPPARWAHAMAFDAHRGGDRALRWAERDVQRVQRYMGIRQ